LRLESQLKTHGSETYKKAEAGVFIRDLLQIINKFAALLLIGMASPYQIFDWYGGRHTCHTASGALAGCLGLSPVISTQFTLEMSVAASNREKNSLKPLFWGSRSFKVTDVGTITESSSAVLVMISSKSVSICNRSQARAANSGKITIS